MPSSVMKSAPSPATATLRTNSGTKPARASRALPALVVEQRIRREVVVVDWGPWQPRRLRESGEPSAPASPAGGTLRRSRAETRPAMLRGHLHEGLGLEALRARPPPPARPRRPPTRTFSSSGISPEERDARTSPPPCARRRGRRWACRASSAGRRTGSCSRRCPSTGMWTLSNICLARTTSASATSCGVVTSTAPAARTCCESDSATSPVPGRQVEDQVVQLAPVHVAHQLHQRAVEHRPAPDERLVRLDQEADRHDLQPVRLDAGRASCRPGSPGAAVMPGHQREWTGRRSPRPAGPPSRRAARAPRRGSPPRCSCPRRPCRRRPGSRSSRRAAAAGRRAAEPLADAPARPTRCRTS